METMISISAAEPSPSAAPPEFTGQVELATSHGSIKTDLPITVKGKISNKRIRGTIGEGNGMLRLKTSFGSIKIK